MQKKENLQKTFQEHTELYRERVQKGASKTELDVIIGQTIKTVYQMKNQAILRNTKIAAGLAAGVVLLFFSYHYTKSVKIPEVNVYTVRTTPHPQLFRSNNAPGQPAEGIQSNAYMRVYDQSQRVFLETVPADDKDTRERYYFELNDGQGNIKKGILHFIEK